MRRLTRSFIARERGATAAEFALILAPLIMLTLGTINVGLMVYTSSTLHFAVEDAARCASVKRTVCRDGATVQAYGVSRYKGATAAPTFVLTPPSPTNAVCPDGNLVTATASYNFSTGLTSNVVPLSAQACYPAA